MVSRQDGVDDGRADLDPVGARADGGEERERSAALLRLRGWILRKPFERSDRVGHLAQEHPASAPPIDTKKMSVVSRRELETGIARTPNAL